jgi:class 3 adenylate cyclase/CHASE2 domain-containing sensor protein
MGGDALSKITAQADAESPVVLVLIDDDSVKQLESRFGPLMWHDEAYLEILKQLQQYHPSVMVVDTDGQQINRLANKNFQAISSLIIGWDLNSLDSASSETLPWLFSLKAGVISNEGENSDGVVRSHKRFVNTDKGTFPSLSVATAIEYLRVKRGERQAKLQGRSANASLLTTSSPVLATSQQPTADAHSEQTWQQTFPEGLLQRKDFLIHWSKTTPSGVNSMNTSHQSIPVWQIFSSSPQIQQDLAQQLNGKIVILGNATHLYRDHRKTPMEVRHLNTDVHATVIDNILTSTTLEQVPQWQQALISVGLFAFVFFLQIRVRKPALNLSLIGLVVIVYSAIVLQQFMMNHLLLNWITPAVFVFLGFLMGSTFRLLANDEEQKAMEYTLSQLVSQSVFQEIQRSGYTLEPGGQKMEITCLFVDIRNFSALAENMPPSAVTELLNEFYTVVEKIIFQHRGTIDKFMGDGILVLFGAPIPTETDAEDAILAAQDILAATQTLSKRWFETTGIQVEFGISINSGPAFVGFLGPIYKLEYTAIGDTVNLCIRLQNENKRFNTRIILSEFSLEKLSNNLKSEWLELDKVSVRGREGLVKVYTLPQFCAGPQFSTGIQKPTANKTLPSQPKPFASHPDNMSLPPGTFPQTPPPQTQEGISLESQNPETTP